jgi:hypothetical protein
MSRSSLARRFRRFVACSLLAAPLVWSGQASAYPSGGALPAPLTLKVFIGPEDGVPVGAAGVIVNVTIVSPLADGWARVYPCGAPPSTSTLNFVADQTVPNLAVTGLSSDGAFCIDTSSTADVIVDLAGYLPTSSTLVPLATPVRFLDTRSGVGAPGPLGAGSITEVQVGGRLGIPTGVDLIVFNATAVGAANSGYVTVFPCGEPMPATSSVNFGVNQTVPNLVASRVSADGKVCLASTAKQHLIGDAVAFTIGGTQGITTLAAPQRMLDTRDGTGGPARPIDSVVRPVLLRGLQGIAPSADAVFLNVTAANASADGFLTVFPCGGTPPTVSNVNYVAGGAVANSAVVKLSGSGEVCVSSSARADVIIDVSGFTSGGSAIISLPPRRIYDSRSGLEPLCNIGVRNKPNSNDLHIFDLTTGVLQHTVTLPFPPTAAKITLNCKKILASGNLGDQPKVATIRSTGELVNVGTGFRVNEAAAMPDTVFTVSLQEPWRVVDVTNVDFLSNTIFPLYSVAGEARTSWATIGASADGSLFALTRYIRDTGSYVVHYFDEAGNERGQWVPPLGAGNFHLSPDGEHIAYTLHIGSVTNRIHVATIAGVEVSVSEPLDLGLRGWLGNGRLYACGLTAVSWRLFSPIEPLVPSNPKLGCPLDAK